tara:strand:- start:9971 stop:11773 length:1803 start_codon:yes stop_codon:yes gene_type:complete
LRDSSYFPIYPNQFEAANKVIDNFKRGKRYALVTAETQSGKTGTCQAICHLSKEFIAKSLGIKNYYFLCGMNDNILKSQQVREFDGLISKSNIMFSKDLQYFGKRNKISAKDPKQHFKDALIFIDESHYAQNVNSMVDKFMKNFVGVTMDGNSNKWVGQNLYIVSISATPMSELVHLLTPNQPKALVRLIPGNGYYGFKRMLELNLVRDSTGFGSPQSRSDFVDELRKLYQEQSSLNQYKYCIIRFSNSGHGDSYRQAMQTLINFPVKYIHFHSESMDMRDINDILSKPPDQFTIIEVYNSLRAGIQMKTENVALVYETSNAKTDSTIQGLPGRCTGYGKEDHGVIVYCYKERLEAYVKLVESDFNPENTPDGSNNVKVGNSGCESRKRMARDGLMFESRKPMGGELPEDILDQLIDLKQEYSQYSSRFQRMFLSRILNMGWVDKSKLLNGGFVGVTLLDETNTNSRSGTWSKFWNPAYKAFSTGRKGSYFRNSSLPEGHDNFYYVYVNLKREHKEFGWCLVTSKMRVKVDDVIATNSGLITTGKEQFNPNNNPNLSDPDEVEKLKLKSCNSNIDINVNKKESEGYKEIKRSLNFRIKTK